MISFAPSRTIRECRGIVYAPANRISSLLNLRVDLIWYTALLYSPIHFQRNCFYPYQFINQHLLAPGFL
jgi:hypothetical protein